MLRGREPFLLPAAPDLLAWVEVAAREAPKEALPWNIFDEVRSWEEMESSPAGQDRLRILVAEKERLERSILGGIEPARLKECRAAYNVLVQIIALPELVRLKLKAKEDQMRTTAKLVGRRG